MRGSVSRKICHTPPAARNNSASHVPTDQLFPLTTPAHCLFFLMLRPSRSRPHSMKRENHRQIKGRSTRIPEKVSSNKRWVSRISGVRTLAEAGIPCLCCAGGNDRHLCEANSFDPQNKRRTDGRMTEGWETEKTRDGAKKRHFPSPPTPSKRSLASLLPCSTSNRILVIG